MVADVLQALQMTTAAGFLAIAGLALKDWLRRRTDSGRGYLALAVGCLGIVSAMGRLTAATPTALRWAFNDLSLVIFLMSGLALLLFRDTVIPLGRRLKTGAVLVTGAVGAAAAAAQLPSGSAPHYLPVQFAVILAVVIVWCLSVGEPSVRMWLIARRLPAVQKARLRALSAGYGGIVAILLSAVFAGSAAAAPAVQLGFALAALALVPLLYAGFAPPPWLRRAWRHREEERFQQAIHDLLIFSQDTTTLAAKALEWALRMAGAKQGFIAFPGTTIAASHAIGGDEAARLCREIGNRGGIRLLRSGRDATQAAIASPLVTAKASGMLVLLADPFTPVFGADEISWIGQYATLVATGLERVAALHEQTELYQALIRAQSDLGDLVIVSEGEKPIFMNAAVAQVSGYSRAELGAMASLYDLVPAEDREELKARINQLRKTPGPARFDAAMRHKDGRRIEVEAAQLTASAGSGARTFTIARDVTARHRVEAQRQALLARLVTVQEEERRQIADGIHDDSIQAMFAVKIRLHLLRAETRDEGHLDMLAQVDLTIDQAITRLRRLLFDLSPVALDEEGLAAAIRLYLDQMHTNGGPDYQVEEDLPGELDPQARAIIYRIAQETLANVRKHAQATRVTVSLAAQDGGVLVHIQDDGRGFLVAEASHPRPGHLGLAAMRDRAEMAGGWLHVESAPGAGAAIAYWIPLANASAKPAA